MDIQGYRCVPWRVHVCRVGAVVTAGLLSLIFYWRPRLAVFAKCRPCTLALADTLIIEDRCGQIWVVDVVTEETATHSVMPPDGENEWNDTVHIMREERAVMRYFVLEGLRYLWINQKESFFPLSWLSENWTCSDLYNQQGGLSREEQISRKKVYGPNLIDVPVKSYSQLLLQEVLNPFYVFQAFSITLWICESYYYYAACIFVISLLSIGVSIYNIRKQSLTLHRLAELVVDVKVHRATDEEEIVNSVDLVPGDCVMIPKEGLLLPFDAALLAGECVVNESMLTGESIPVTKTQLPTSDGKYNPENYRKHTVFCGTEVIQARGGNTKGEGCFAIVTQTGFFTAKGQLISSILFPKPTDFRFTQDAMKFLCFLGVLALVGTIYSLVILWNVSTTWELIIQTLDILTIVVPPALPAAMTTGIIFSLDRLKKHGVSCISPTRINLCGKVSVFCFDKTGTLTEEGLDVEGVVEASMRGFGDLICNPQHLAPGLMLTSLACCHSVALVQGEPKGDPLDLKMMESTGWLLEEPKGEDLAKEFGGLRILGVMRPQNSLTRCVPVAVVRRFPFSSALQRMSVVTIEPGGHSAKVFLKGSPEMVASLCQKDGLPAKFSETLHQFASQGYRVLALAYKQLDFVGDVNTIERTKMENGLQFLGLLVMRNLVKPGTAEIIDTMQQAQIRTIMVTGDNMLTAVNAAHSCGMVAMDERVIFVQASSPAGDVRPSLQFLLEMSQSDEPVRESEVFAQFRGLYQNRLRYHLAIDGKSFASLCEHFPDDLPKVLMKCTVYARMAPEQKTQLVTELQKLNYRVGMCGDGANDCGALRAADVGVSLSEAEASVASPFTSKTENIRCVPLLIQEGRCCLVTSFSLFRFMALYSLIQFASVLILYTLKTNLGDFQFLFFDLALVTFLAVLMGRGGPSVQLHPVRPPASLLSVPVMGSLVIHTSLIILGQVSVLLFTRAQKWYVPLNATVAGAANLPNVENTCVFATSGFQYIIMAVVVTKGHPYKKPLSHNIPFVVLLLLQTAAVSWLVMHPAPFMLNFFQLTDVPHLSYKVFLLEIAVATFLFCYLVEVAIEQGLLSFCRRLRGVRQSKKLYKRLDVVLSQQQDWPPVNQTAVTHQCSLSGFS